jgi:hypothetical protein
MNSLRFLENDPEESFSLAYIHRVIPIITLYSKMIAAVRCTP